MGYALGSIQSKVRMNESIEKAACNIAIWYAECDAKYYCYPNTLRNLAVGLLGLPQVRFIVICWAFDDARA